MQSALYARPLGCSPERGCSHWLSTLWSRRLVAPPRTPAAPGIPRFNEDFSLPGRVTVFARVVLSITLISWYVLRFNSAVRLDVSAGCLKLHELLVLLSLLEFESSNNGLSVRVALFPTQRRSKGGAGGGPPRAPG